MRIDTIRALIGRNKTGGSVSGSGAPAASIHPFERGSATTRAHSLSQSINTQHTPVISIYERTMMLALGPWRATEARPPLLYREPDQIEVDDDLIHEVQW